MSKCGVSPRCRQPVVFMVVTGSWPSVVCEKHLGLLATRLLAASTDRELRVTPFEDQ